MSIRHIIYLGLYYEINSLEVASYRPRVFGECKPGILIFSRHFLFYYRFESCNVVKIISIIVIIIHNTELITCAKKFRPSDRINNNSSWTGVCSCVDDCSMMTRRCIQHTNSVHQSTVSPVEFIRNPVNSYVIFIDIHSIWFIAIEKRQNNESFPKN